MFKHILFLARFMVIVLLLITLLVGVNAKAAVYSAPVDIAAAGGTAGLGWAFPIAVISGVAAVVLIANQVDPWTPVFGADGVFYEYPKN